MLLLTSTSDQLNGSYAAQYAVSNYVNAGYSSGHSVANYV